MEKLKSFDFDNRPSRSKYAAAVSAIIDEGYGAVILKRGEDFTHQSIETVQGSLATEFRKRGKIAETRKLDEDSVAVRLNPDQTPRRRRKASGKRARQPVAA